MHSQNKREFVNNVTVKLTAYEEERKKRIRKLVISELGVLSVICAGCLGVEFFLSKEAGVPLVLCATVVFFATVFFFLNIYDSNKDFKTFLKNKCQKDILKVFNLQTINGMEYSKENLVKSNLFSTFNSMEFDDVIQGCDNGVCYKIAETELIAKGRKNETTVFKGVIISFKSNKEIKADTLITTKGDINIRNFPTNGRLVLYLIFIPIIVSIIFFVLTIIRLAGLGANAHLNIFLYMVFHSFSFLPDIIFVALIVLGVLYYIRKNKMQDVKLEGVSFDKRFNVYTKDQIEARYLITPSFMERFQNLKTAFGTRNIKCSFFDNQIMFAIPTRRDLFELGSLFKTLNSSKSVENFYNELSSILQMVNHFKLTEKTGL